jgi:hypothetical protein
MRAVLLVLVGLVFGCSPLTDPPLTDPAARGGRNFSYSDLEGGCWGLRLDGGGAYQATIPDAFRHDGLQVRAGVKFRDDLVSYCQMGRILEVLWMRRR